MLFYWTKNTTVSIFVVILLKSVVQVFSDLNSNTRVLIVLNRQTGFPAWLLKTGAADQHVLKEENTYSNPDNLRRLCPAAVSASEHHVYHGCSLKPNCDKLDEKLKLSLSQSCLFCTFGLCSVASHRVRLIYSNVYAHRCHEIKQYGQL